MKDKRLAQLEQMRVSDPADPFLTYAIAQEYVGVQNYGAARVEFEGLMARFPEYLPGYYHYALTLCELGEQGWAVEVLGKGLELARAQGDRKTAGEIGELLEDLE